MTTFTLLAPTTRAALLADLEELWQRFDELVGTLEKLISITSLDFAPAPGETWDDTARHSRSSRLVAVRIRHSPFAALYISI